MGSTKNIYKCGTSIGALVRESEHAESKMDFVRKLAIAQKEANESDYCLELLYKSDFIDENMFMSLNQDLQEIKK